VVAEREGPVPGLLALTLPCTTEPPPGRDWAERSAATCARPLPSTRLRDWLQRLAMLLVTLVAGPHPGQAEAATCTVRPVGDDLSLGDSFADTQDGEAIGQTFAAPESLIRSITVWRVPQEAGDPTGFKLYIVDTTPEGAPDSRKILLDGPTVVNPGGDGINPTPITFTFDPAFALPHRGQSCFALQARPCLGLWAVLSNDGNAYSGGSLWLFGRSDCFLRLSPRDYPLSDLIFTIEFCDSTSGVESQSWGGMKILYR